MFSKCLLFLLLSVQVTLPLELEVSCEQPHKFTNESLGYYHETDNNGEDPSIGYYHEMKNNNGNQSSCQDLDEDCEYWASNGECDKNSEYMYDYCPKSCDQCTMTTFHTIVDDQQEDIACEDFKEDCEFWAAEGECEENPEYMNVHCPKSCQTCDYDITTLDDDLEDESCTDVDTECPEWAAIGECSRNADYMRLHCKRSCLICNSSGEHHDPADYDSCKDHNQKCGEWAEMGECSDNPGYMEKVCCQSCNSKNDGQEEPCVDLDEADDCTTWALRGECVQNPDYMHERCKRSCKLCVDIESSEGKDLKAPRGMKSKESFPKMDNDQEEPCVDLDEFDDCMTWAQRGECFRNTDYMHERCKRSCHLCADIDYSRGEDLGVPQENEGLDWEDILYTIEDARKYMQSEVLQMFNDNMKTMCQNQHELCAFWAFQGHCEMSPETMLKQCGPVCNSCQALMQEYHCPIALDLTDTNIWEPGDLNKMFKRLTSEPYKSQYSVEILSSPATNGPWVITMDNVISDEEADRFIEVGHEIGYERSADVGKMNKDGTHGSMVYEGRTSTNAWCNHEQCESDEIIGNALGRVSDLTGIPLLNAEYAQLLRYEENQKYNVHHDMIPHHVEKQCGPRILTFYLYLNEGLKGGETNFDQLGISVTPKKGRAVVWPSVLDEDPNIKDDRTTHQAMPVLDRIKYGANLWYHLRDFRNPDRRGCV